MKATVRVQTVAGKVSNFYGPAILCVIVITS